MSQKFIKSQNKNSQSPAYGKYFATAVYDNHFIGTEELSDFIQRQASVKKSDIKAVLQELGEAFKHFFELGQKIKLDGIGIFKVGFSSIGVVKLEDCGAQTITTRRVLFQPETTRVVVGQQKMDDGSVKQKYVNAITMLKDVVFEETHDNAMNVEPESSNGNNSNAGNSESGSNGSTNSTSGDSGSQSGNQGGDSNSESVTAPEISGTTPFEESTTVTIQGPQGASLHYTIDGSTPSAESPEYSEPFTLTDTATIRAIAILNDISSSVSSKTFTKGTHDGGDSGDGLDKD
jgi:predicted histone-like DNA-binding protein